MGADAVEGNKASVMSWTLQEEGFREKEVVNCVRWFW